MDVVARHKITMTGRPDGQPMFFAHGFGCDQNMWRYVAPRFEDDFRVVTFDHVGAGRSDLAGAVAAYTESASSLTEGVLGDVLRFQSGQPRDDIAVVAVRVL